MADVQSPTPQQEAAPQGVSITAAQAAKKRKKRMRTIRNIIVLAIVLALVGVLAYFLWMRMQAEEEVAGDIITTFVDVGSITSKVEGGGSIRARDSSSVAPPSGGTVKEIFVAEGDQVTEGQLLFTIDSSDADETRSTAQKKVDNILKELGKLNESYDDLMIRAPHAGQLTEVGTFRVGDDASAGVSVATLVDNTRMKLSLYYSYAYENQFVAGQAASISVPATMSSYDGVVTEVNYVRRVATEGSILFHAVFEFDNPGTLTADMVASASLTAADGSPIYAYESGKLEYSQVTEIVTKSSGPVLSVNLLNYMDIAAGDVLLNLGAEDTDLAVIAKEKELSVAREELAEAQKGFDNLNAVAPMSGTVMACSLKEGERVESGQNVTISDTTVMIVNANVDDRNIGYVTVGMEVQVDQWGTPYFGYVESISMEGTYENGSSVFPIVIRVDNPFAELRPGMGVQYSFISSQSSDCMVIPIQCVKYYSDPETEERLTLVWVQTDMPPENTIDISAQETLPEGFHAVVISTGISDSYNVEVLDGLEVGQTIYQATQQENYW